MKTATVILNDYPIHPYFNHYHYSDPDIIKLRRDRDRRVYALLKSNKISPAS